MDPLKIDLVLTNILTHLSHPIDLKNCRLVDQHWNLMATSVLNDRGFTCVVSDENYYDFFQNRSKNIAGLNITLNLTGYSSGRSLAVLAMTKELQQDIPKAEKAGGSDRSYRVKSINYRAKINCSSEYLDATILWPLVDAAAPDLDHLLIAGPLKSDTTVPISDNGEDVPAPLEPATQFPALKSVTYEIRRHSYDRTIQLGISRKLAQILSNAPLLEEYKLVSDRQVQFHGLYAGQQLWFMPTEVLPTPIKRIAGLLKTFGFFIMEGDVPHLPGHMTLEAVHDMKFQSLQALTVLQLNGYPNAPHFLQFLAANASTLTSLEYTFIFARKVELIPFLDLEISDAPLLENVTHFGLYYRNVTDQSTLHGPHSPIVTPLSSMILQLQRTCRMCPNLTTLATDINLCQALAVFEHEMSAMSGRYYREPNRLESFSDSKEMREEKNPGVTTLEVTIPHLIAVFELEDPGIFGVCMANFWPDKFPALHKLILKADIWPHPQDEAILLLPSILNIPGITDLEIVEYCQDWIGQELHKCNGSLANLQQGLRRLRLSSTKITARQLSKLSNPQRKLMKRKSLKWPEGVLSLCGVFQALEEVVIDRRVFLNTIPVLGGTTTDKGVKITVL